MREDDFERQGERLVILFEGRDAAGKTSSIRETFSRLAQTHASVRIMKPARPSDEERAGFWFDRFGAALDATKDANVVLSDRSWYVRPTVERVMGYCSP